MTVDVATGEQLQKLNLFDFKDVQQLAPGLEITNIDGRSNSATLRGVTFNPDQGTSPTVDVYINEVPVDAQTAFTAIYDVAQIEVLRGTQGAFRGRTAPAGAITLTTRRPSLTVGGRPFRAGRLCQAETSSKSIITFADFGVPAIPSASITSSNL